jgi:two-component system NtrC family sensor kinase
MSDHGSHRRVGPGPSAAPREGSSTQVENQFQALLEGAPDAVIIVDEAGSILIANGQAGRLFGYDVGDLIGQPVERLLPSHLRERHVRHRYSYVGDPHTRPMGNGLDLIAQRKDGSIFPVEISLSSMSTTDGLLVTSVIRDVTERKRAADELERQVQQRTAHLNALLQVSRELFSARSLDGVLQRSLSHAQALVPEAQRSVIYLYEATTQRLAMRASAGFSSLPSLNIPLDAVLVRDIFERQQTLHINSQQELVALLGAQQGEAQTTLLEMFELTSLPSGLIGVPLRSHEQVLGVLLLIRVAGAGPFAPETPAMLEGLARLTAAAISEEESLATARTLSSQVAHLEAQQALLAERLNAAEAGMLQAARLAAVGQLAASIAHEINNPLYAARNCLYLLEGDLPPDLSDTPYLAIARDELGRIAGIIERMRDFYRPPRGELAPCDLNMLVEETLAITSLNTRHMPVQVIFTPTPDLPMVVGNSDQLRQVLLNLLLNAVDAMPSGGSLTVRTLAGPTVALLEIQDTGIGIPPDVKNHLFEPFFTTKPTGTGLGLSISAHIVTQHGGQIEVDSEPGHGTTFRVALPYRPET